MMYCPFKLAGAKASGSRDTRCERGDCALWKTIDAKPYKEKGSNKWKFKPVYGCALRGRDSYNPCDFEVEDDSDGES